MLVDFSGRRPILLRDFAIVKIALLLWFRPAPFPPHGVFAVRHLRSIDWLPFCDSQNVAVRWFGTPENEYKGLRLCVTGKITSYRSRPEIVATERGQIEIQE
jgi:hypothetical protein